MSKSDSNKLQYKVRTAPQRVKDAWARIKKGGTSQAKSDFARDLMTCARGDYAGMEVYSQTTVESEDKERKHEAWMAWPAFVKQEGLKQALAMVEHKTVTTRDHPKLVGTGIEFPDNQQVFMETISRETSTTSRDKFHRSGPKATVDADEARSMLSGLPSSSMAAPRAAPAASGPVAHQPNVDDDARQAREAREKDVQSALVSIRKTHSEWDRKRREYSATLAKSARCVATHGNHFETEL